MHFGDCLHESSDTGSISWLVIDFFGPVIHGIKFADFVAESDLLKQGFDFLTTARHLEVVLSYSHLSKG